MTLFIKYLLLTLLTSYSCFALAKFDECKTSLRLSSTSEWYPYIYQDENGVSTGTDVELLSLILTRMGCKLEVFHFPERRALLELKLGRFDIVLGASKTADRAKEFFYSTAYRNEINKFAYRADDADITPTKSLQRLLNLNKIIAINYAGWYGEEIETAKSKYQNFSYSPTTTNRLKMLHLGRVDAVIDDEMVLCSELQRNGYRNIVINTEVLFETPIYFIFNKESVTPEFVTEFNNTLESMKIDKSLAEHFYQQLPKRCKAELATS
ncbi:transporter substrate-binding domain-containing protein [Colwellia sp. D2M02]|uniref:substrate-binding periplasmic protein n=1 Tax=Colwellia sp. D2M02 TaxID=2841562 RepID=UPI001C084D4E|nr:transporter substrate-binding domain-containing protein [Colwellia sp. D2M02]MBU2892742.1 transporter substrate-binding domain-containing protein [Colwellia sp. D2M02]